MNKPELYSATFVFTQEGNCIDGEPENLEIVAQSDLGIDFNKECFYTIKTESWSFDSIEELQELIDRINKVLP